MSRGAAAPTARPVLRLVLRKPGWARTGWRRKPRRGEKLRRHLRAGPAGVPEEERCQPQVSDRLPPALLPVWIWLWPSLNLD